MDRKIIKGKVTGDKSKKVRKVNTADITTGMVQVIVICWLIPFLALSVVLFYYSSINSAKKTKQTIQTSLGNVGLLCKDTIDGIVKESKQASYDGVISQSYSEYLSDVKNGNEDKSATDKLRVKVNKYLGERYKYNKKIAATFVLFTNGGIEQCYTISNMAGATYSSVVSKYVKYGVKDKVLEEAENLGTGVKMVVIGNEMYLIRNIVDKDFVPYAIIMMELNSEKVFEGLNNVVWKSETFAIVDEELIGVHKGKDPEKINSVREYCKDIIADDRFREKSVVLSTYDSTEKWGLVSFNEDNNQYSFVVIFDKNAMENDGKIAIYLYIIILLLLVPLMIATVAYFYKNVSNPIAKLMYASEKIEKGKYGYQIEEFDINQEFNRLIEVFNEMSSSLKNSFDRLYAEEIAVRDANMQALQAQINPHFLNNTLEIINWKARIAGNDDVSGMIESLGVMMEATMNRKGDSFITLREEMTYVDAYLYIIEQRFGEQFSFEKEVDEDLLDMKIPRLIIQPLVENMVEHGVDENGKRKGKLKVYSDNKNLYIEVINYSKMSDEDKKKVRELLSDIDYASKKKNIGIRNVNMRLRMLYGRTSGLTINDEKNDMTISKIVIEIDKLTGGLNK